MLCVCHSLLNRVSLLAMLWHVKILLHWIVLEMKISVAVKRHFSFAVIAPIFVVKLPKEKTIKVGSTLLFNCLVEKTKLQEYLVGVDILAKG